MSDPAAVLRDRLSKALVGRGAIPKFCRDTGLARNTVENWLSGKSSPNVSSLPVIAKGLGTDAWKLIRPEDPSVAPAPLPGLRELIEELQQLDQGKAAKRIKIFRELLEPDLPEKAVEPVKLPGEPGDQDSG